MERPSYSVPSEDARALGRTQKIKLPPKDVCPQVFCVVVCAGGWHVIQQIYSSLLRQI